MEKFWEQERERELGLERKRRVLILMAKLEPHTKMGMSLRGRLGLLQLRAIRDIPLIRLGHFPIPAA
jgi:hypothetical protein